MPTRFPGGLTTAKASETLGMFVDVDPTKYHLYFEDFDLYTAANWTVTETGVGTRATADEDGGVLVITNAAGVADGNYFQLLKQTFTFTVGKKLWFKTRFKISDATLADFIIGLQVRDTTPLAVSDGVYLFKPTGATTLKGYQDFNSAQVITSLAPLANGTYVTAGFYFDGVSSISWFVNDVMVSRSSALVTLPTTSLCVSFCHKNGEAVAKILNLDYILAAKER
jgi:hypothetical protein